MATDREIHSVSQNPTALRTLAASLLNRADAHTDWEIDFLESLAAREGDEPSSYRQAEKLLQIRDQSEELTRVLGFSIPALVDACWQARFDLDDDESIAFVDRLHETGATSLRRGPAYRLLACARRLGVVDGAD